MDVLVGSNKDEHLAMGGKVEFRDTLMWSMRLFAERQTAIGKDAYWYFFTHEPPVEPGAREAESDVAPRSRMCSKLSARHVRYPIRVRLGWRRHRRKTEPWPI